MADLRAVLAAFVPMTRHASARERVEGLLAALAAADEPLVAEVECPRCQHGQWHSGHTVTVLAMTEDVLRERLRASDGLLDVDIDFIVRALLGPTSPDEGVSAPKGGDR